LPLHGGHLRRVASAPPSPVRDSLPRAPRAPRTPRGAVRRSAPRPTTPPQGEPKATSTSVRLARAAPLRPVLTREVERKAGAASLTERCERAPALPRRSRGRWYRRHRNHSLRRVAAAQHDVAKAAPVARA